MQSLTQSFNLTLLGAVHLQCTCSSTPLSLLAAGQQLQLLEGGIERQLKGKDSYKGQLQSTVKGEGGPEGSYTHLRLHPPLLGPGQQLQVRRALPEDSQQPNQRCDYWILLDFIRFIRFKEQIVASAAHGHHLMHGTSSNQTRRVRCHSVLHVPPLGLGEGSTPWASDFDIPWLKPAPPACPPLRCPAAVPASTGSTQSVPAVPSTAAQHNTCHHTMEGTIGKGAALARKGCCT